MKEKKSGSVKPGKENKRTFIEVEAKTAAEAIKIALEKLGAKRSEVDIQILREENKGLFSMQGSKLAKIRVSK